jgi:hypothetical protein
MREHAHLATMVGFVRKHVAQHFGADRPRLSPAVSEKRLDAVAAIAMAERFRQHFRAASGALGQSPPGLLRRAVRAVELWWNLQMRCRKPDPLTADIVHVREDRRNGASPNVAARAGRFGCRQFGSPDGRVKMFNKHLVHALIGGKDLDCGSAELSVNLVWTIHGWTRGHGSLLFASVSHDTSNKVMRLASGRPRVGGVTLKDEHCRFWQTWEPAEATDHHLESCRSWESRSRNSGKTWGPPFLFGSHSEL